MKTVMLFWYLFMCATPHSEVASANGPMSTREDCKYVERQMVETFHPHKIGCIEIPAPKPERKQ